ncbi:MAG: hypothetical protein CVV03_03830 [Firmicutes bacterium HGW-Firmicutes-8]|nr:MAG: hypothetical protein CVV03_03830 [Firmicutes bacterium HGW-Firmicutes-8]
MRRQFTLICCLLLVFSLTGCLKTGNNPALAGSPAKEKTLVVAIPKMPFTLNPVISNFFSDSLIYSAVSEPLIKYAIKTMEPAAGIAKSWDVKEGKIFIFHLNGNVYFSNGKQCTAHDFKYSYEKYLTPESRVSYMLEAISGSKEKLDGKAADTKGIKVLDDFTLEITLDKPNNNFLAALGSPCLVVINKDEVEQLGTNYGNNTITGVGPFKVLHKDQNEIVLARNDRYYGKKAYVDSIRFVERSNEKAWNEYNKGIIDLMFVVPNLKTAIKNPKYKNNIKMFSDLGATFLAFNLKKEPMKSNKKLREAVSYAINKEYIVNEVLNDSYGVVADSITPPILSGRNVKTVPSYSKEIAKVLLAEAGYPNGRGLPELNLTYHDRVSQKMIVESVKKDLESVNIKVKLIHADESLIVPYVENESDLFRVSWGPDYLDMDSLIQPIFHSKGSCTWGGYQNKDVDALIDEARLTPNFAERKYLLTQAEEMALQDYPLAPLYWGQFTSLSSSRVKNLQISAVGYPVFENIMIEE